MTGRDETAVTMLCPMLGCKKTVKAQEWMRGKTVRCPHCNTLFRVPTARAESAAPSRTRK